MPARPFRQNPARRPWPPPPPRATPAPRPPMRTLSDLTQTLASSSPAATRAAAATALTAYPADDIAWSSLTRAEHDPDPSVAAAASAALDAIFTDHPDLLVLVCARDGRAGSDAYFADVERYVARLPTSRALAALFPVLERADAGQWDRLLAGAASPQRFPTDELPALLTDQADRQCRWVVAQLMACRNLQAGYEVLLDEYSSPNLIDGFVARGVGAVRHLCELVYEDATHDDDVVMRLAQRRKKTEATVHELAMDPGSKAAGIAAQVLGFWDSPRSIETLLHVAGTPAYPRDVRNMALHSLCLLQAPEAITILCEAMRDASVRSDLRRDCVRALGLIGNAEPLPALEALTKQEKDDRLVEAARQAIEAIRA